MCVICVYAIMNKMPMEQTHLLHILRSFHMYSLIPQHRPQNDFFFSNRRLTKHTYPSKPKSTQHTHRWTDRPTREELGRKSTMRKVEVIVRSNRATFVMLRCVFYQQIKGTYTDNNNNKITCFPALVCYIHIYVLYTV